jgi:hypothetical protein
MVMEVKPEMEEITWGEKVKIQEMQVLQEIKEVMVQ